MFGQTPSGSGYATGPGKRKAKRKGKRRGKRRGASAAVSSMMSGPFGRAVMKGAPGK